MIGLALCMLVAAAAPATAQKPPALTPDDAVRAARENNESIRAFDLRVEEERPESRILPMLENPSIRLQHNGVEELFGPRTDDGRRLGPLDDSYIALRLPVPPLKELGPRQMSGQALVDEASAEALELRRELLAEVRLLHSKLMLLQAEREAAASAVELTTRLRDHVVERVRVNAATAFDESVAALDALDAIVDRTELESEERTSRHRLAALLGRGADDRFELIEGPRPLCRTPDESVDALVTQAIVRSPKIQAIDARLRGTSHDNLATSLALVPWLTDIQIALVNEPLDKRDSVRVRADIELPLFDLHLHEFDALRARRARLEAERRAAMEDVAADTRRAYEELEGQRALVELYKRATEEVIDRGLAVVERAVETNDVDLLRVVGVRQRSLKAKRQQLRARLRCEEAAVELAHLIGVDD
jgi:cobalt-zinc-cadmium efflux system outer membrane protein